MMAHRVALAGMNAPAPLVATVRYIVIERVSPTAWHELAGLLSPEEASRAQRFHDPADQAAFTAAHALVRYELGMAAGVDGRNISFRQEHNSRPVTLGPEAALRFGHSLTHCRSLAACALSEMGAVGVDAERVPDLQTAMDVAEAHFAPCEVEQLRELAPADQAAGFTRLWVLKEALLKALGRGLAEPLRSASFDLGAERPTTLPPDAGNPSDWQCAVWEPTPHVFLATAVRCRPEDRGRPGWDFSASDACGSAACSA